MLSKPLIVTQVASRRFHGGHQEKAAVVNSFSIILIRSGSVSYRVDDISVHVEKNTILLVPAWARREWYANGSDGCELQWCDFSCPSEELSQGELLHSIPQDIALEQSTIARMLAEWTSSATPNRLLLEGELKAQLARFFTSAEATECDAPASTNCSARASSVIDRSLALCSKLYNEHNILSEMRTTTGLSAAHFRRVFKSQHKVSPGSFVLRLRMRHARFLLHESERTIKEISDIVGYDDAFYFSRLYRRYWGCPPSEDRGRKTHAGERLSLIDRISKHSIESSSAVYQ
jgi:AraC-like DNA-binding protein